MAQNGFISLITSGLSASRPPTVDPLLASDVFYLATDTGVLSYWNAATLAWAVVNTFGVQGTVAAPVIPSTTHTIAGAVQLTAGTVIIASANAGDAVKLRANAQVGQECLVYNTGAAAAGVYPGASTDSIDAGSAGAAATLTNAKYALFACVSNVAGVCVWKSFGGAGPSA
jgi:hypothetical protein